MLEVLAKQVVELLELQHRTAQLDRTYSELRASNAKLAGFAGRVSHDLRIPLTTILGYVELVEDDPDIEPNSTAARYLDRIGASGRRMLGMLEDVLSYSRVGGGIQPAHVSLREVTEEVVRDLGIENDGIVDVQDITFHADRGQLRTLLQNLLSNAMNYRSPDAGSQSASAVFPITMAQPSTSRTTARASNLRTAPRFWNPWCGCAGKATVRAPGWAWPPAAASRKPTAATSASPKPPAAEPLLR